MRECGEKEESEGSGTSGPIQPKGPSPPRRTTGLLGLYAKEGQLSELLLR